MMIDCETLWVYPSSLVGVFVSSTIIVVADQGYGRGVLKSCMAAVVRSWTLASLQCRDGARRVFTDQADIGLHQARSVVRCWASRMKGELHPA